ncbi:hypothetical protein PRELSG_0921800 [Plasmodium relictum]|uniref:Uncharacterized protein n=1 Tax=Plasmodium relictum TaxID=85471 RepID=A0A1J1H5D5_PLARL|nr:hypothetical protein PRELSG_0921800 [Plasmodium relictum]CRH00118.1 hypothetical protein PRELSG_0921800 [Plasmodium relictum]
MKKKEKKRKERKIKKESNDFKIDEKKGKNENECFINKNKIVELCNSKINEDGDSENSECIIFNLSLKNIDNNNNAHNKDSFQNFLENIKLISAEEKKNLYKNLEDNLVNKNKSVENLIQESIPNNENTYIKD